MRLGKEWAILAESRSFQRPQEWSDGDADHSEACALGRRLGNRMLRLRELCFLSFAIGP